MNVSNTSGYIDATVVYSRGKPDVFVIVNNMLLFICIVVGNSIVRYIYKTKFKADMVDRYFVPFLAVVDLLGLLVCGSFEVTLNFMHFSFVNTYLCKSWWFLCGSVTFLSVLILFLIAVQRYVKIVKLAGRQMDFTLNRIALFCAVCFAIVCAVPLSIIDNTRGIGTVIGSALAGLYFTTGRIIFRHVKQTTFSPWNDKDMSITCVPLYILCYIPHVLIKAFKPVDAETTYDVGHITFIILSQIYIINNVCNPVLYVFMDTKLQWNSKELLHCHRNAQNNTSDSHDLISIKSLSAHFEEMTDFNGSIIMSMRDICH